MAAVPFAALAAIPEQRVAELSSRASAQGEIRIILQLNVPHVAEGELGATAVPKQRHAIASRQQAVAGMAQGSGAREVRRFRFIPFSVYAANANGIRTLGRLSDVVGMQEDVPESPALEQSAAIVGAPTAWSQGYDGSDRVIAVLDTGVDLDHIFFAEPGKLIAEACFSTGDGGLYESLCPGGVSATLELGSGDACPAHIDGCDHGTHVAGIALGNDGTGPDIGIASGAQLISAQVFSLHVSSESAVTFPSDQIAALEQIYQWRDTYPIAVVNMSLGGFLQTDQQTCDDNNAARKAAVDNLRSVGIPTVAATGNSGSRDGMFQPACISSVISVAASTSDDQVASFSNIAPFIDLLAPGVSITSATLGGGVKDMSGTSMATPHVAGAWAILRQAGPAATVDDILAVLNSTGAPVDDTRSGGTVTGIPRIDIGSALTETVGQFSETIFGDGFED